ncbi:MAG TPA: acyltransferase domain-containing protein [Actinophytocola sp.]|jgi:acyl transferase domain-containing protein|nr:acyltransferase domain-containing protein [Actinophytocola sp.]
MTTVDEYTVDTLRRPAELIAIGGDSADEVRRVARELGRDLALRPGTPLADVVRGLPSAVADGPYRLALLARDTTEAARRLRRPPAVTGPAGPGAVYLMFPGVGDHHAGMAAGLYRCEPVFRHWLDHCAAVLHTELGTDLRTLLYPPDPPRRAGIDLAALLGRRDEEAPIDRTEVAQPLVFAVEYALARLLLSWGLRPAGLLGYSVGEYVAATLAGVLDLDDALTLVARRARLIQELPPGAMTVAMLGEDELRPLLDGVALAAVDGPRLCVAAGPVPAVARLEERLAAAGVAGLRATARHAFHSPMLDPVAGPLTELVRGFRPRPPAIPFLSNVTGTWITAAEAADPGYWARHAVATVRCHDNLAAVWADPDALALEVGPGHMLGSLAVQHPARPRAGDPPVWGTAPATDTAGEGDAADVTALLTAVGGLWQAGARIDWPGLWSGGRR